MDGFRRLESTLFDVRIFHDVQDFRDNGPAGRGWGHGNDLVSPIRGLTWLPPDRFILGQISGCNEAAIFLHILDNEFGCFARIEISRVIGNAAQDFSQVLLDKDFSFLIETAVLVEKIVAGGFVRREAFRPNIFQGSCHIPGNGKSFFCHFDGWFHEFL